MADAGLRRFRAPIAVFTAMTLILAATGAVLFVRKMGLRPGEVTAYYLGTAGPFGKPRTLRGLLEVAVPHLLAVPLVLFVALHLVAFAGELPPRTVRRLSRASFGFALIGLLSGFGIRWVWPALSVAKIAAFVGFEATLAALIVLLVSLLAHAPEATEAEGPARSRAPAAR